MGRGEEALYDLFPSEFVAARTKQARELRKAKEKVEADRIKALRKPTITAWGLNQLAKNDPALIEDVLARGAALRDATSAALDGDASGLQAAQTQRREAIKRATAAVRGIFGRAGQAFSETMERRAVATLRAATVDAEVAGMLRAGRLSEDHETTGFGLDNAALTRAPDVTPRPSRPERTALPRDPGPVAGDPEEGADGDAEHRRQARDAEVRQAAPEAKRQELQDEAIRLAKRAEHLGAELDNAERRVERAGQEAAEAEERLSEAALVADETRRALGDAQREANAARAAVSKVEGEAAALRDRMAALGPWHGVDGSPDP